jgi:endonuclease/exonuclease/phosphatase family metal-dependent hydrolase
MSFLVRTWNLYHGRTFPKTERTYLERMVRLISLDAPDAVALQEVPLWALGSLERWSGMQPSWAVTVPNLLGPIARWATNLDPVRMRFTVAGQANVVLLNPHFEVAGHDVYVMNPQVSPWDVFLGGRQRRVCQALHVETDEGIFVLANLHATNNAEVAKLEVGRAAEFLSREQRIVLCGDFNVPHYAVPQFSAPIRGIDQILVRGLELVRGPEPWPEARRRSGDDLLSDHAPVEAELAWT